MTQNNKLTQPALCAYFTLNFYFFHLIQVKFEFCYFNKRSVYNVVYNENASVFTNLCSTPSQRWIPSFATGLSAQPSLPFSICLNLDFWISLAPNNDFLYKNRILEKFVIYLPVDAQVKFCRYILPK